MSSVSTFVHSRYAALPLQPLAAAALLAGGMLLALPPASFRARQEVDEHFNMLDSSWQLDLPARLARGEWAGRDFVFTYGPLYQVTHALGLLLPPHDLASLMRWHGVVEAILVMLCVWFLLWMMGGDVFTRGSVYLLWAWLCPPFLASLFTYNIGLKPLAGLTLVTACGFMLGAPGTSRPPAGRVAVFLLWSLTAPVLLLYSFDLGVLALVAELVAGFGLALLGRGFSWRGASDLGREARKMIVAALAGAALLPLILLATPWRHYIRHSWEVAHGYMIALATACTGRYLVLLVIVATAGIGAALLAAVRVRRLLRNGSDVPPSATALFAAASFCVVWVRYGLTRSEWDHVWPVIAVAVLLCGGLLPCYLHARGRRLAWLLLGLWAVLVLCKSPLGSPAAVVKSPATRLALLARWERGPAELEVGEPRVASAARLARGLPGDYVYVWPYETIAALAAQKANPTYTEQTYAAHDLNLERLDIARLEAQAEPPVLLFTESWPIDDVDHISRTSSIFRYLLEHYERAGSGTPDCLLLRPRAGGAKIWGEHEIASTGSFRPGNGRELTVPVTSDGSDACFGSDLYLLRIRLATTRSMPWSKPGELFATFTLSSGQERTHRLVVPADGCDHDVLVSACVPGRSFLVSLFDPARRLHSRERVTGIQLRWTPMDRLSTRPSEITLQRAAVLRREAPLEREESVVWIEQP